MLRTTRRSRVSPCNGARGQTIWTRWSPSNERLRKDAGAVPWAPASCKATSALSEGRGRITAGLTRRPGSSGLMIPGEASRRVAHQRLPGSVPYAPRRIRDARRIGCERCTSESAPPRCASGICSTGGKRFQVVQLDELSAFAAPALSADEGAATVITSPAHHGTGGPNVGRDVAGALGVAGARR